MLSINGNLKLRPGVKIRRYFPKIVITTIVPCFTDTNDENKTTRIIKTKIKVPISGVITNRFMAINIMVIIGVLFVLHKKHEIKMRNHYELKTNIRSYTYSVRYY